MVAQARDLRGRSDPETRLDHAAEHDTEVERPRSVRDPHGLTDSTGLRELDVDTVRALGAGCEVAQAMAVLVDVDRDGRRRFQACTFRVTDRQGLFAVQDAQLRELGQCIDGFVEPLAEERQVARKRVYFGAQMREHEVGCDKESNADPQVDRGDSDVTFNDGALSDFY